MAINVVSVQIELIMILNGFEIKTRLAGTPQEYHTAKRGDEVFTSKSMSYIKRKIKDRTKYENDARIRRSSS